MKTTYFFLLGLLFFSEAIAQTKPAYSNFKTNVTAALFGKHSPATNVFYTIEMLGKTKWEDYPNANTINLTPKNFNWYMDSKKLESYRNWFVNSAKQDLCGRDFPADVNSELIQSIYSKSIIYRWYK